MGIALKQTYAKESQVLKNLDKQPKLYSWHAPEVECISKGKSRNPYDGHTLQEQVEQASILMQATGVRPQTVYVDLGYRGVDQANPDIAIKHRGRFKSLTDKERKNLKRRQAIEPIIGHLKADHRMNRCHLLGAQGDSLHAVLCAARYNIRWLLRMIAKKGVPFLQTLFLLLLQHSGLAAMGRWAAREMANLAVKCAGGVDWIRRFIWLWAEMNFSGTTT